MAKSVKFPHSSILHYAFSSWIEKTRTKTIHCHWENICFTIIWACAEILLRNLSWLRMGSCVHFCCYNILFLRTMCSEGSPWSMLWRVKFAHSPIIIASKTMSCSELIVHDNLAHPLAYMLSAFLYLFWFKNQEKNWLTLQWLKLLEFKPFWCKWIEN